MEAANRRGIPVMKFIDDIDTHLRELDTDVEAVIADIRAMYSKYKFLEQTLLRTKSSMNGKIPEIKKTLAAIKMLSDKKDEEIKTHFCLADGVYAKAAISDVEHVSLWLGANVMVQYTFDEAIELLTGNLNGAQKKHEEVEEDLNFLKDQTITSEVNLARLINFNVRKRKKEAGEEDGGTMAASS